MKLKSTFFAFWLVLLVLPVATWAQSDEEAVWIYLVRHAEKMDSSRDPELSEAGKQRALALAHFLGELRFDAFYSTDYKRTRSTLEPLAQAQQKEILVYEIKTQAQLAEQLKLMRGKRILLAGHSNTLHALLNAFTETEAYKVIPESRYGDVWQIRLGSKAEVQQFRF